MLWNYDVSDKEEAERMASLYGEDFTRAVEPGMEVETGRNLVRRCGNELGVATWEAYDFDPDTWTCETFSNREAAELWLSGSLYLDECNELDDQLTQSVKRMATLVANMSGGRWTAGIQEYRDGRKSLSRARGAGRPRPVPRGAGGVPPRRGQLYRARQARVL